MTEGLLGKDDPPSHGDAASGRSRWQIRRNCWDWLARFPVAAGDLFLAERNRWFLWLAPGLGSGIVLYFSLPVEPPDWVLPLTALWLIMAVWFLLRGLRRPDPPLFRLVMVIALSLVATGFAAGQLRTLAVSTPVISRDMVGVTVTGRVLAIDRLVSGRSGSAVIRVTLGEVRLETRGKAVAPDRTPDRVRLRLTRGTPLPDAGQLLRMRANLHPPPEPSEPGAFDFQRHAFFQGIGAVGFAVSRAEPVDGPPPGRWSRAAIMLEAARESIADKVAVAVDDPGAAAVTTALMNGEQTGIPDDVMQAMRDSGLAHLLSISGLHIGLVAGIIFFVSRAAMALVPGLALHWPIKKIAASLALLAALAYTLLVGAPLPTVRSVLMTGMVLLAVIAERDPFSMRLVAFAALVTILMQPDGVLGPSFQMSFAAVVALIAGYEVMSGRMRHLRQQGWIGRVVLFIGGLVFTSLIASLATMPFALYHFQQVALFSVLSNMLAVPLTSVWVMPFSLIAYGLMPLGWEGPALAAMGWGVWVINEIAFATAALPMAVLLPSAMPDWGLALITTGGLWLCLWRRRWRLAGLPLILVGLLSPLWMERPTILVANGGELIGLRLDSGELALSARSGSFVSDGWRQRDGGGAPASPWPATGKTPDGRLACDALGCLYEGGGQTVSLPRHAEALEEDCHRADLVIFPGSARFCVADRVIDRGRIRRSGPLAIYLRPDQPPEIISDHDRRGVRPWVVRRQ